MDSQDFKRNLDLFLLGDLDPARHQEMREYLEAHPEAQAQVDAVRKMLDALQDHLSEPREPPGLSRDVLEHIWKQEQEQEQAMEPRLSAWMAAALKSRITRIAAAVVVILASLALVYHVSRNDSDSVPVDELAIRVRARLLEISETERREDGFVLWRTRWEITKVLHGDPGGSALGFRPAALAEKSFDEAREHLQKKEAAANNSLNVSAEKGAGTRKRREMAGEPPDRREERSAPGVIEVLLLRPDETSKHFVSKEEVGDEQVLLIRRIGRELFALDTDLDTEPSASREARSADFSGRWSGVAADKPEDGTSRDSLTLDLTILEGGRLEGVASGEFVGDSPKNFRDVQVEGNRLGFVVEHRTGSPMEITLDLIGSNLVGEGSPADPDGDRCDVFLSRMDSVRKEGEQ